MMTKVGGLYVVRHAAVEQVDAEALPLQGLSSEARDLYIERTCLYQGLSATGRTQAAWVGRYLGREIDLPKEPGYLIGMAGLLPRQQQTALLAKQAGGPALQKMALLPDNELTAVVSAPQEGVRANDSPAKRLTGAMTHVIQQADALKTPDQPAIFFTSAQGLLASLAVKGVGSLADDASELIVNTSDEQRSSVVADTLPHCTVIAYHDPEGTGAHTHFEIHQPTWTSAESQEPAALVRSGLLPIPLSNSLPTA